MSDDRLSPLESRRARILRAAERKHVPLATITVALGMVVVLFLAGNLLYRLRDVVMLMAVGGFIALMLNPLVLALQRWKIHRRGAAVAVVTLWAVLVFVGLGAAFGYPLVNGITHFANSLPGYIAKAEHGKGWIGHLVRHYHIESWVQRNSPKLISFAEGLSKPALSLGKGAAAVIVAIGTTFVFVVLLLLEAPKMRTWLLSVMSPKRAERYSRVGGEISQSVAGYVVGDLLTSVVAGVVVFITLAALSVPYPFLWALWVAIVDFLPTIGGALAGIPTVLFALGHSFTAGLVTAIVFLAYTQFENHVLNPMVMSRTVKVNPLLVMVSVLVGADIGNWVGGLFGGFVAALLAIPIAGAIQVIARDLWRATEAEPEPSGQVAPGPLVEAVENP